MIASRAGATSFRFADLSDSHSSSSFLVHDTLVGAPLAIQSSITRVVTFQLAREVSTRTYPQIGVSEPHHADVASPELAPEKLAKLAKINAYHVSLFGYLLEKLQATKDGDGTLLDNSLYVLGSGLGNPDVHDHTNLPILVAGGGAGMKGGPARGLPSSRRRLRTCTRRCSTRSACRPSGSPTARPRSTTGGAAELMSAA